ncbi:hypothetical protein CKO28_08735 [Rhodovibrio sodomensis]|uniref:DUF3035 domain-containing protein n=1 Tax=Rhodovibrio sodomensis TaxID=1088 RepID=A0ABS1DFD2_9PROT|nr:DUF3035 domain-containing protein [Rhodovibrio sodomensis]MBK1668120.1 hypothetical protein [Rhodovibrio sodomensis]
MIHRHPIRLGLCLLLAAPMLAGCSDAWRTTLGLKQTAPNEFKVAEREPLAMPPSLNELPAPQPGAERPQATSPRMRARQALFAPAGSGPQAATSTAADPMGRVGGGLSDGASGDSRSNLSDGEQRLLARANADAAPDDIRRIVAREAEQRAEAQRSLLDDYIFWREPELPGVVVDADAEARRLRDNQAQGQPLTEGEVPIEQREDRGLLGNL